MAGQRWRELAVAQEGMLSWRQLRTLGVSHAEVRHHVRIGRWAHRSTEVVSTTTGPLSTPQRLWLGVLHAGPSAMLGGLTAAEHLGLKGWPREEVTVLVANEMSFERVPGFRFFRTRRTGLMVPGRALPVCRLEPAVLIFASEEPHLRTALGAVAEVDVHRACRAYGIAPPTSQRRRRDRAGRVRYTDCEWRLADGRTLVLEIHGGFHDDVLQAVADRARNRKLTTATRVVVQCSAFEMRHEPWEVMEDLVALGVPRRPAA